MGWIVIVANTKACGMPASTNEEGYTRFDSLYRWLRRWFIWWKCPWATLASIVIASPEVLKDLRIAFEEGEKQSNDILEKWLFCKELSLITKNKTFNFTTIPSNVTKTCSNAAEMERNFWQGDLFSGEEWCNFPWTGISQKNFQIMSDYL